MNCDDAMRLASERLAAGLPNDDEQRLAAHLQECSDCRTEARAMTELWDDMQSLEPAGRDVPHARMRARLHAALAAYEQRGGPLDWLRDCLPQSLPQGGFALMLLAAGLVLGHAGVRSTEQDIAALQQEVHAVSLALLDHQSAAERLRAVDWMSRPAARSRTGVDPRTVEALIDTVSHDRSVNVRLAAVDALRQHLESPQVVRGLTAALPEQHDPLLQVALGRVLLESGAGAGIDAVRRLAASEAADPRVRADLSEALRESRVSAADTGV